MNRTQMQSLNHYCSLLDAQETKVMLAGKPEPKSNDVELNVYHYGDASEALLTTLYRLTSDKDYHNRRVFLTIQRGEG